MEGWPIETGDMTFFLEREDNVLKKVCLAFSNVGIEHAPNFSAANGGGSIPHLQINGGGYAALARKNIINWQSVMSGIQIVDLDFDNFELRFRPEKVEEEEHIHVSSFKSSPDRFLNETCDFEQFGRAFCAGRICSDRIESTSHYREGRIAYEAGRFVDAYNNMFLFLETRYCDGKTGNERQVGLLLRQKELCATLDRIAEEFAQKNASSHNNNNFDLFRSSDGIREKIKTLVLLRGKLRHHSLKSPLRWDPNKQSEHEGAARFLGAVVGDIVLRESLSDIYAPAALKKFREISIRTGFETKIKLLTHRLNREKTLALDMSYPTTVVSSRLCLVTLRNAIKACEKEDQLSDTVKMEAKDERTHLELFSLEFQTWAYTKTREIRLDSPAKKVRCSFEHFKAGGVQRHEFSLPFEASTISIIDVWNILKFCHDYIEKKDPTTRVASLKLYLDNGSKEILAYRIGAQVVN